MGTYFKKTDREYGKIVKRVRELIRNLETFSYKDFLHFINNSQARRILYHLYKRTGEIKPISKHKDGRGGYPTMYTKS